MARKPDQGKATPAKTDGPDVETPGIETRASRVGDHLRGIYDDVLDERVPDIFQDLLRKLG